MTFATLEKYAGGLIVLALMCLGALALHSAVGEASAIFYRQLIWFAVGLLLMLGLSFFDYRSISGFALPIFIGLVILLTTVLLAGKSGGGSQRWLALGSLRLQPSEFAKVGMIIVLAQWCATHPRVGGATLIELIVPLLAVGTICGLVLLQPDLGTAVALLVEATVIIVIAGIHRGVLLGGVVTGLLASVLSWFFVLKPYQKRRVFGFLNPEADPLGIGYHTIQSKIAIGAGGVRGSGFGGGQQTTLQFLPEQHTDFIFAVWSEEWGFFGVVFVLALYVWLMLWVTRTALEAKDVLGRLLAGGMLIHLVVHVGLNLAMVVGWAPVVGLPLPWMTYGGSSVIVNCLAMGLVLSVRRSKRLF